MTLLNGPVFVEAARELAERVQAEVADSVPESLRLAFRLCLSHEPSQSELEVLLRNHERQRRNPSEGSKPAAESDAGTGRDSLGDHETGVLAAVASVLLNLAEFLTRA